MHSVCIWLVGEERKNFISGIICIHCFLTQIWMTPTHTQKYLPYLVFSIKNNNNNLYVNIAQYYCMSRYLWSPEFIPFSFYYVWSVLLLKSVFFRLSRTRRFHKHSSILMNEFIHGYDYIAASDFFKDTWTWRRVIRDDQNNFSKCLHFDYVKLPLLSYSLLKWQRYHAFYHTHANTKNNNNNMHV